MRCSHCAKLIIQYRILSGNTFGARFWTDGKVDAPMLPDSPELVKCPHCKQLVWINELEELPEPTSGSTEWREKAHPYIDPAFSDYLNLLRRESFPPKKEQYLRFRLWWAGNDLRRGKSRGPLFSDDEIDNLSALAKLLDETAAQDRLTKAEIMRELGDFTTAEQLLREPFSPEIAPAANQINALAKRQISLVAEMNFKSRKGGMIEGEELRRRPWHSRFAKSLTAAGLPYVAGTPLALLVALVANPNNVHAGLATMGLVFAISWALGSLSGLILAILELRGKLGDDFPRTDTFLALGLIALPIAWFGCAYLLRR